MLTIIEIQAREDGGHGLQSQSHRKACWLEGWVAVPEELTEAAWACGGYCELTLEDREEAVTDDQGRPTGETRRVQVLTGITPTQRPPEPAPEPTEEEKILAALERGLED